MAAIPASIARRFVFLGAFSGGPNPKYPFDWRKTHRGALALLLECPGDGRHWVNQTSSCARMWRHHEGGGQVLGLVPQDEATVIEALFGEFPHQGDGVCDRCSAAKAAAEAR